MATKDNNHKSGSGSNSGSSGRSQHKSGGSKKSTTSSRSSSSQSSSSSDSSEREEHIEFPERVSNVIMAAHQGIDVIEKGLKVAKNTLEAIKKMREI
jgi:hypothetical protein